MEQTSLKLYAYIYLENFDKTKYKSILKNLNQQYSFGNNQHPTSIIEANSILNSHKFDGNYTKSKFIKEIKTQGKRKLRLKKKDLCHLHLHLLRTDITAVANLATNRPNVDSRIANQKVNGS